MEKQLFKSESSWRFRKKALDPVFKYNQVLTKQTFTWLGVTYTICTDFVKLSQVGFSGAFGITSGHFFDIQNDLMTYLKTLNLQKGDIVKAGHINAYNADIYPIFYVSSLSPDTVFCAYRADMGGGSYFVDGSVADSLYPNTFFSNNFGNSTLNQMLVEYFATYGITNTSTIIQYKAVFKSLLSTIVEVPELQYYMCSFDKESLVLGTFDGSQVLPLTVFKDSALTQEHDTINDFSKIVNSLYQFVDVGNIDYQDFSVKGDKVFISKNANSNIIYLEKLD